jgi:hypothetical protein
VSLQATSGSSSGIGDASLSQPSPTSGRSRSHGHGLEPRAISDTKVLLALFEGKPVHGEPGRL